ncbi:MAG: NAD+ synthase [Firmicutes bacterium]|nr:NAD+ synthase [Bacillota bacterium]
MKIALAQINPVIGDLKGNVVKIINYIERAKDAKCDLVVFSELSLVGYPPRDLLLRTDFVKACQDALIDILPFTREIGVLLGSITPISGSDKLYNSAILLDDGRIAGTVNKSLLPNYDVFEEDRYFEPSSRVKCLTFRGMKLGVSICEDIWNDQEFFQYKRYDRDILDELYKESPDIFINLSASPYHYSKHKVRVDMVAHMAGKYDIPFIYVNQVGGNDELIFDGSSMVFNKEGKLILSGGNFVEDLIIYDTEVTRPPIPTPEEDISWMHKALVLGFRDYFHKTGFKKTLLGLSGGIDSALIACLAVDALGKENVLGVSMPSRYSSGHSRDDARDLAENLGIEYRVLPIENTFAQYIKLFNGCENIVGDLAEENIQARIRGNLLMFLSNREGRMLVSTGNKSEIAVGYSTLYGDMCGGLSVIGDIPKTLVYKLCNYINRDREIIPVSTLTKPPSAELRPNQVDQDSLPPYEVLDAVIHMYIEENLSLVEMVERGYDKDTILKILNMIDRVEYKRRQAPPVLKMTTRAFGMGRKIPIAQGFRWV